MEKKTIYNAFFKKIFTFKDEKDLENQKKELLKSDKKEENFKKLDINNDGKFDEKDKSKAGKILATKIN
jgi:hypothetical protein